MSDHPSRRLVVTGSLAALGAHATSVDGAGAQGPAAQGAGRQAAAAQSELPPTPSCGDDAATLRQGEGPFFKPRSPERVDLREAGIKGEPMVLTGFVLTRGCRPVERALVDLWHADDRGAYDNDGFHLRGHQYTDAQGRYRFLTIVPAADEGRTRHYHVKVQPPGGRLLTTQLYFPGEPQNRRDGLFRRELLMKVAKAGDAEGRTGHFDFVLDMR
jgi:protocatechuate 3,4-dioxygenase beta subunit